ncbi:MAG: T9SS type A sorting domain-containing protein [Lentimicrobiaceae bacterium]|nr:T9SS type A sorting domain-containing protein [Lentimicrobiaceae bacterium]
MKNINYSFLLSFWLLLPTFAFAQDRQSHQYFSNTHETSGVSSPKILPTEVQNAYDVKWYFLNLNAEKNTVALSGNVTIKAEVVYSVMDTFSFHLHRNYIIDSILINGVKKNIISQEDERLVTGLGLVKNTVFDAQIFYRGTAPSSGFFSGISTAKDTRWGDFDVTWTLSQPNHAYYWFPVKQDLTDKADSSWVFVTTTKPNKVASNGLLTNVVDLPNNKVRYEWKSCHPINYYLISMAIAEYQDYSIYATIPQTGAQVLIQNYIYNSPQCLSQNKEAMDKTKEIIEFFSEILGEYPFSSEKYGHALANLGNGAMEHQTMTTTGSFDEGLVVHELVHQWFGNQVTCASWEHIWLHEGFARYGEFLWWEYKLGREQAFHSFELYITTNVINNGKTGSVYVPIAYIDDVYRIFNTTLSYNKGGVLVHMIRYELGDNDELFFNVLQTFQNRFKHSVATAADFKNVLEELSGKDFTTFFNQWYYGEGYPKFQILWHQIGDEQLYLISTQITTAPSVTPLFKITYELEITYTDNSSEIVPFYHDEVHKELKYNILDGKTVKSIKFDPNRWLLATGTVIHTYAIEDFGNDHAVIVYPNPATEAINIKFDAFLHGEKAISVFNVNGKMIQNLITTNDFLTLNINDLPSGTYFLSVRNGENVFVRKFVK